MKLLKTIYKNYWINRNQIPLGSLSNGDTCFKIIPKSETGKYLSDFTVISAMTRRGKSVILRNLYYYNSLIRPIIVIDWIGDDHKLSYYTNPDKKNLPPYQPPMSIKNAVYLKYPAEDIRFDSAQKLHYEIEIKPNLRNYIADELRGVGFPLGSAMYLRRILKEYPKLKTIHQLIEFIKKYPTNKRDVEKNIEEQGPYKYYDILPIQSKNSMLKWLYHIEENEQFDLKDKKNINIIEYIKQNKNVFMNFSGNIGIARVEIAKLINEIISYMQNNPEVVAPIIYFEEADEIIPRRVLDKYEREKTEYVLNVLIKSILRAPKHRIGLVFCTPALSYLHGNIVNNTYEKIFGELHDHDLNEAKRLTNEIVAMMIKKLRFDRMKGIREFVYYTEKKIAYKFIPYACPQRFHKE